MALPTRWILATKWFLDDTKTKSVLSFWTPFGGPTRIPFSYSTCQEAMDHLKEIAKYKDDLKNLMVVALEVRYAPNEMKVLKQQWFDKYVKQEVNLQIVDKDKGKDVFNG